MRVAKHGNRSISSKCGSADVMEALGVNIQLTPERAAQCLREVGICFLYAPDLHSSMKQVQKVRRELRLRTMFNLLGPLTNPARATAQVVGNICVEIDGVHRWTFQLRAVCNWGLISRLTAVGRDSAGKSNLCSRSKSAAWAIVTKGMPVRSAMSSRV